MNINRAAQVVKDAWVIQLEDRLMAGIQSGASEREIQDLRISITCVKALPTDILAAVDVGTVPSRRVVVAV